MDRGAWQAIVREVTKSWTRLRNQHRHTHVIKSHYIPFSTSFAHFSFWLVIFLLVSCFPIDL